MLLSKTARRRAKVWALSTASATALAAVAVTNVQAQEVAAATIDSVVADIFAQYPVPAASAEQ